MAKGLPTLPRLARMGRKPPSAQLTVLKGLRTEKEVLPSVAGTIHNSSWEVWMHDFLLKQNPYWIAQVQFGMLGVSGATRPDWINDMLGVAFYLDTPVHIFRRLQNKDQYVRASVRSLHYKVVEWYVPTFDYMVRNASNFYRNQIEGLGAVEMQ